MTSSPTDERADDADEVRTSYRDSFDQLNDRLVGTKFHKYLRFFNFGYAVLEGEEPAGPALPRRFPNLDSAQLLFQVVGDTDLTGRRVAEVGCGRGGNIGLLLDHAGIASAVGLDLAGTSLDFCRQTYPADRSAFAQSDAEALPLADGSVDAVVNIESSGCYPDVERFFREVARVLAPGGWFLWADLSRREMVAAYQRAFGDLGLEVAAHRDITPNVLASRAARAERQRLAFGDGRAIEGFEEWVGADGSALHEQLSDRRCAYTIIRARKVGPATAGPGPLFSPAEQAMILEFSRFGADVLSGRGGSAP
ncbi:MAG: class I SAM-dependent methyltransferase [Acidimicrobiales bacterium]